MNEQMHVLGGYGEQRVDRAYHHVYDSRTNRWMDAPPLPRGADAPTRYGGRPIGAMIYVAGGGPVMGGSVQSALHEAFTLGPA